MAKLTVKNNVRGQFLIKMTTPEGTINCVVSVPFEAQAQHALHRRDAALGLAKSLARRLDEEIKDRVAASV